MSPLLLPVSALVPALLLLWYFWSRDLHPEPRGVVLKTFLLGALICLPVVPVAGALEALGGFARGTWPHAIASAFLGAAIPEELFKFLVLRLWVWKQPAFDEPIDGLVYGATASLGFAALENLLYVGEGGVGVAVLRALTAVPGHALTGAVMGAYVGEARFAGPGRQARLLATGWLAAVGLHGAYDALLMSQTGWAFAALLVLWIDVRWVRVLVARMQRAQGTAGAAPVRPALADFAEALPLPDAAGPTPALPRAPEPAFGRPPRRTPWAQARLLLGGVASTVGVLACLGLALAADHQDAAALWTLCGLAALPTAGALWLFRSGLRGPFRQA